MSKTNTIRDLYFPERIFRSLSAILDYPLTLVEAPIGYGKTTAVKEYLSNSGAYILWQRVNGSSITGFWNSFCQLLKKLDIERSQKLEQIGLPTESISLQEIISLIEDIKFPNNSVLVIDDYHLVNNFEIGNLIEFIVMNEINNLHIVLITRYIELPRMEELSLKGYIYHIKKETLELLPKEIMMYYKLCGISIKEVVANELYSYTEGWISVLYMMMLDYKKQGKFISTANIYKLVEAAVFKPFHEETKKFLLMMCPFDSFTIEQVIYIWGNENARELLTEVISKNAFVNYDIRNKTYQMHNIFTNYLKEIMDSKDIKNDIYERAAQWFLKIKDYLSAMHYFYLCGNFEGLLFALGKDKSNSFNHENKELFNKYIDECPNNIKVKNPLVLLTYAMHLFTYNEMDLFGKTCSEFIYNLEADEGLNDDYKSELLGEYELLLSFTAYNDINKMSEHHQNACKLLNHPSLIYDTKNNWTFGSPSILYMFYRETGQLEQNVADIIKAMPYYYQLTNGHGSGAEFVMEAERYFNIGDIENAEISLQKASHRAQSKNETGILLCAEFLKIRIAVLKGDISNMLKLLAKMRKDISSNNEYFYIHTVEICEGYIYSLLKQKHKIPERIAVRNLSSTRIMYPAFSMLNIVYGRVLLINGEYLKLIGSSEHFIEMAGVFPNLIGQLYTYIYLAAANKQIYRKSEAQNILKQALDIAMPDKLYMPFVENCDYIEELLEELKSCGIYSEDIEEIFKLHKKYGQAVEQITSDYFSSRKPQLAEREMEIALLAAEGFSNKEIGEKLYISHNTVKTQLKSVFEKLGVNSRALLKQNIMNS